MTRRIAILIALLPLLVGANDRAERLARRARAQANPDMTGSRAEVYKTVGDTKLKIYIFEPKGHRKNDRRAAIVFFFGGGWRSGSPQQFAPQCRHLAELGMVAMAADYRVKSRQNARVIDCIADAKSAIRWVRKNADRLGIDSKRIAAGGGSAGGHLAAATATLPRYDEPSEDARISSKPDALLLFNPAIDLTPKGFGRPETSPRYKEIESRFGTTDVESLSPYHHIERKMPPTIIFHGTRDTTVPYAQVEAFTKKMTEHDNRCTLVGYKGQGHGFFNAGREKDRWYRDTLAHVDEFLETIGFIAPRATTRTAPCPTTMPATGK